MAFIALPFTPQCEHLLDLCKLTSYVYISKASTLAGSYAIVILIAIVCKCAPQRKHKWSNANCVNYARRCIIN